MKKALISLLLIVALNAYGQDNRLMFGFNTSLDWNSYVLMEDIGISDLQGALNYASGITVKKYFSSRLSVSASVNYAARNFKEHVDYSKLELADPIDEAFANEPTYTYKHGFIDIPVSVAYSIVSTDRLQIAPSAGIVNSVLIHDKEDGVEADDAFHQRLKYNSHLIATQIGFGFLLKQENFGILLEPQARVYAAPVHDRGPGQNPFQLSLSASFLWWR